jgi:tetratricopeptide (TPR) repeat protein
MKLLPIAAIVSILSSSPLLADTQQINITGDNNLITQIVNKGLSQRAVDDFIKPYKDRIKSLKRQLERTVSIEVKYQLSEQLNRAIKELNKKSQQIKDLNKFIANSKLKVVRTAAKIYEEKGLDATLKYFKSNAFKAFEKQTQENMKELSGGYRFQAKLLALDNKYDEAKKAYKKALKYDRNVDTLFDYAYFLQTQNYFEAAIQVYNELLLEQRVLAKSNPKVYNPDVAGTLNNLAVLYSDTNQMQKAEQAYSEALRLRRALAKSNPKVYNPDVAMTLNNLAVLYRVTNQMQKAEQACSEALRLYRALAKSNPKVYGIDLANSLVMGVDLLKQPSSNLDEAETTLQNFRGIPKAEWLLGLIEKLRKR